MNQNRGNNRRRGRGGNRQQGGQANRIDSRARGNAPQLLEKYKKLAHDAQMNGDRVQAEYYLQFADHYFRVVADSRAQKDEQRGRRDNEREQDNSPDDDEEDDRFSRQDRREPRSRDKASRARLPIRATIRPRRVAPAPSPMAGASLATKNAVSILRSFRRPSAMTMTRMPANPQRMRSRARKRSLPAAVPAGCVPTTMTERLKP